MIGIEFLRTLAKPRAFIFLDEQLQPFDRLLRRRELALDVKARGALVFGAAMFIMIGPDAFGFEHGALRFEQSVQIGRKLLQVWRDRSSASCRRIYRMRGAE